MTWESIEIAVGRGIVYGFLDFLRGFDFVLLNGGWILLALFLGWLLFINRWIHIMLANIAGWKIITLNISIPDMPSPSIMSAEQIFTHLHNYRELNWRERWLKGMVLPWYSFEIVSLGGSVHFIVKCVDFMLDHVKAAIYSQYPEAEITEVGDYIEAIHTPYNPENVDYDFWGTELMLNQHDAIPVKTYESFEHRAAEVILDPLAPLLEYISGINSDEIVAIQFLLQGTMDKKWNEDAKKQIEEKKGSKKAQEKSEGRELNYMRYLSDAERDVIKAMQTKLDKPIFNTKIRILYIAPKDKISLARLGGIFGSFKIFGGTNFNSFKPNKFVTTTQQSRFSDKLESNRVKKLVLWKKRDFIKNFKKRQISSGGKNMHLATNEIATMYHFPLEVVRRATVERVDARKGEPPANIPL